MIIHYARSGGHPPPPDREILTIEDDGTFTMWRSIGAAVQPPSPVGRFSGKLDDQTLEKLKSTIGKVTPLGDLSIKPKPGSSIVTIDTGQVKARMGIHDEPDNAWTDLVTIMKRLLKQLVNHPEAAIRLTVSDDGQSARLEHLGLQPIELDLSQFTIRAVLWEGYKMVGDWSSTSDETEKNSSVMADSNWQMDLPFDHNFDPDSDQNIIAYVTFSIKNEGRLIPVRLTSS